MLSIDKFTFIDQGWAGTTTNLFKNSDYKLLEKHYPKFVNPGEKPNVRMQYSVADFQQFGGEVKVHQSWIDLTESAPDFFISCAQKFRSHLKIDKNTAKFELDDLLDRRNFGLRGVDKDKLFLVDIQPGINTVNSLSMPNSVRGPHIDSPLEVFALLSYFQIAGDEQGGHLQIVERKGTPTRFGKAEYQGDFGEITRVEYAPNHAALFVNGPESFHAVTDRMPGIYERRLLNVILEINPLLTKPYFQLPFTPPKPSKSPASHGKKRKAPAWKKFLKRFI